MFRVGGILAGGLYLLEELNQGKIPKRQQFGKLWKKLVADGLFSIYILNGLNECKHRRSKNGSSVRSFVCLRSTFLLSLFYRLVFGANLDVFLENFRCEFLFCMKLEFSFH